MLRSSVRLVSLLSPLTQSCRYMGRGRMWNTKRKPMMIEFNERRQIVELDSMLKVGWSLSNLTRRLYRLIIRKVMWRFKGDHLSPTGTIMQR